MRRACVTIVCALLVAVPAAAQEPQPQPQPQPQPPSEPTVAQGVTAGGVDLSAMTASQAEAALNTALQAPLARDFVLSASGIRFHLTMTQAKLRFDAHATAQDALAATAGVSVPLVLRHSRSAVQAWVNAAGRRVYHAPLDATLRMTVTRMIVSHARAGLRLQTGHVAHLIDRALDTDPSQRALRAALVPVRPTVTYRVLQHQYPRVLTVDRGHFTLRLFRNLRPWRHYGIAVGMAGLETPAGMYRIQDKQVNPAWHVPNSPWAGSLAGQVIPGGAPSNPLKARWLGIANGVGIHGTAEDWSIGSRASHGCIRMHVSDVIDLYPRVPVGTPVLIT